MMRHLLFFCCALSLAPAVRSAPAAGPAVPPARYADADVVVNEIQYNPSAEFDDGDWVELHNRGAAAVDLSNWTFRDDDDTHGFTIPGGTMIAPGGFLVLVRNDSAFASRHPGVENRLAAFDFGLGNNGDAVRIFNAAGLLVDSVAYDDAPPWPLAPDGTGPTLELRDPALDNADAAAWAPSRGVGGTPGARNSVRDGGGPAPPLLITEINYNGAAEADPGDWVELYNPNAEAVDLDGWSLSDGNDVFAIPAGTVIGAGAYLVIVRDDVQFLSVFASAGGFVGSFGFGLGNGGDEVLLFGPNNFAIDRVRYYDTPPWPPQADGTGRTLELRALDLDNAVAENWQASREPLGTPGAPNSTPDPLPTPPPIVINEINYNSLTGFDPGDWVELYNPNPEAVDVSNWSFKDSDDADNFRIPDGTFITGDGYFVIVDDSAAFQGLHPSVSNYVGNLNFNLSNGGELIRLYDANAMLVDSLTYDDEAPWPLEADGTGNTLELIFPDRDNADPANWAVSRSIGGSPGLKNGANIVDVEADAPGLPDRFSFSAVYPNPTRGQTTFRLDLPHAGRVRVDVFDTTGRRVAALVDAERPAGRTEAVWSAENLSAGLYFARLVVDGAAHDGRRVVVVR